MSSRWRITEPVKRALFRFLETLFASERGRKLLAPFTQDFRKPDLGDLKGTLPPPPYADLPVPPTSSTNQRADPVFITARFRSGSTLLWNLFRNIPDVTAYYEPFNERRWFDPVHRGRTVDASHLGVDDYWREYEGLESLGDCYREDWIRRRLFMDGDSWDPQMQRYIEMLIEAARGRPVLQFNRVDFRLAWLKKYFPAAKLVHIFRHPRDQWCSTLVDLKSFGPQSPVEQFPDRFYLGMWVDDLQQQFPYLRGEDRHPYELFYLIWRTSHLFGRRYTDYSFSFESLLEQPDRILSELFETIGMDGVDLEPLKRMIARPKLGKWRDYAEPDWFLRIEERCEAMLRDYWGDPARSALPLTTGAAGHALVGE